MLEGWYVEEGSRMLKVRSDLAAASVNDRPSLSENST